MKKISLILLLVVLVTAGAFAKEGLFALGGGAFFDMDWNHGVEAGGDFIGKNSKNFGGYAFLDIKYLELNAGMAYGVIQGVLKGSGSSTHVDLDNQFQVGFSLLGKYPFGIGPISLFPLLGVSCNMVLPGDKIKDMSQFGFLGGAGVDIKLKKLFLRGELLFNIRLPNNEMSDLRDFLNALPGSAQDAKTTFGLGPTIKVGLGYRFF
jgi:hypothetical protein